MKNNQIGIVGLGYWGTNIINTLEKMGYKNNIVAFGIGTKFEQYKNINLKNKKVLITGATGGIGNSLVEKFNSLGAIVVASGTNEEKLYNLQKNDSYY